MDIDPWTSWPFLALIGVVTLGYTLLTQHVETAQKGISTSANLRSWLKRTGDVRWWMQVALPLYMLHQFEEYGLDLYGRRFQFQHTLCSALGFDNISKCPILPWHTTSINVGLVILAAFRARSPGNFKGPGANFFALMLINAFIHCLFSVRDIRRGADIYNPGLFTGCFLLFPAGCAALRALHRQRILKTAGVIRALIVGIVAHIFLLGGLRLRSMGQIGDLAFVAWETLDFLGLLSLSSF